VHSLEFDLGRWKWSNGKPLIHYMVAMGCKFLTKSFQLKHSTLATFHLGKTFGLKTVSIKMLCLCGLGGIMSLRSILGVLKTVFVVTPELLKPLFIVFLSA